MTPIIQSKNEDGTLNVLIPVNSNFFDATGQPLQAYVIQKISAAQLDDQIAQATSKTVGLQSIKDAASKLSASQISL